jgi:hypothetical protein
LFEAFLAEGDLVENRNAPFGGGVEGVERAVEQQGGGEFAALVKLVGELVAGAALPGAPAVGGVSLTAFVLEEGEGDADGFLFLPEFGEQDGEEVAGFGAFGRVGIGGDEGGERGDGGGFLAGEYAGLGGFEAGAGAVGGREIEEVEAVEEADGLGVVAHREVGLGDFELGGADDAAIAVGLGLGEFEGGVDDRIKTCHREAGCAECAEGAAEFEQGGGQLGVVGVVADEVFVGGGGFHAVSTHAVGAGHAEERGRGFRGVGRGGGHLTVGDHRGLGVAGGEFGVGDAHQALAFFDGKGLGLRFGAVGRFFRLVGMRRVAGGGVFGGMRGGGCGGMCGGAFVRRSGLSGVGLRLRGHMSRHFGRRVCGFGCGGMCGGAFVRWSGLSGVGLRLRGHMSRHFGRRVCGFGCGGRFRDVFGDGVLRRSRVGLGVSRCGRGLFVGAGRK